MVIRPEVNGTQSAHCLPLFGVAVAIADRQPMQGAAMLNYALIFLVLALVAGMFGYGGAAVAAAGIARILFLLFLAAAVVAFLAYASRKFPGSPGHRP